MKPLRTAVAFSLSSYIQAVSGERKTVGAMAFTVMPVAPHSQPRALVMPSTAAFDLGAELFAFGRNFVQRFGPASHNDEITTGCGQHLRGKRAERAGRAGDNRGFAANLEQ